MSQGTVLIQTDRCKGCALCVSVCPQHVLLLGEGYNARGYHPVELDESAGSCTGCAICAVMCPDVVFTVLRTASLRPAQRRAPQPPTAPLPAKKQRPAIQPIPAQGGLHTANGGSRRGEQGHNGHNGQGAIGSQPVASAAPRSRD